MKMKLKISDKAKRWLGSSAVVLFVLWVGFVGFVYRAMRQPPEVFGHVMARMPMPAYFLFPFETMWTNARRGTIQPGDVAPSLTVKKLEDKSPIELGSLWAERPVVLVFGSYT
jgi:hypothetical protein